MILLRLRTFNVGQMLSNSNHKQYSVELDPRIKIYFKLNLAVEIGDLELYWNASRAPHW